MNYNYEKFRQDFKQKLEQINQNYSNIVFLCIGTNKLAGDCIGPVVGSYLSKVQNEFIQVYGTIEKNLNFSNAINVISNIYKKTQNPYIIAIDAALSNKNNNGDVVLSSGYIKIGKALNKSICFYSNINIKCVVGHYYNTQEANLKELEQVSLKDNLLFAKRISSEIRNVLENSHIYV